MRSQWLSRWILQREPVQPEMPHSRERFRRTFLHGSLFCSCWNSSPTLKSDGAQKNFGFCCCVLSCIWNSNELVCSKIEEKRFELEWIVKSIESCSRRNLKMRPEWYGLKKLDMPALKPHDNFFLPHHLKSIASTPLTRFSKNRGVLLWRVSQCAWVC